MKISISVKLSSLILSLLLSTLGTVVIAQNNPLMVNNGAMFFIAGGLNNAGLVWVDGTVEVNDSVLINRGKLIVKKDFVINDQCGGTLPNQTNTGVFEIYGDWENNGTFRAGTSRVRFMDSGYIEGDSVTSFFDLELVGHIKRDIQDSIAPAQSGPTVDVIVSHELDLDYGEFAANFNTLWITNPATGAILRENCDTCGFVSSLDSIGGDLARVMNQDAIYLFPTGSSKIASNDPNSIVRYRPVLIKPSTSDIDTFHVEFVNRNPNVDNLPVLQTDNDLCYVNPWWYHKIHKRSGNVQTAELTVRSNPFEGDENYNTIANWSVANDLWEKVPNTGSGVVNFLPQVVAYNYGDYQLYPENAYALAYKVPLPPVVSGDTELCADVPTVYTVPDNGNGATFDFTVTGGTIVTQDDHSVTIVWDNDELVAANGTIEVTQTIPNSINGGCESLVGTTDIEIWPLPVANFTVVQDSTLPGGIFIHDILGMVDSSLLTSEWYWDFGDGVTSTDSMPYHSYYETGTYDITLVVRSGLECLDTLVVPVNVVEGLIIPNVFTPNGDGWNDVFDVRTSAVGNYKLQIYNRWGNIVFENSSPLISWDGTTSAGVQAPAGTYFYVITNPTMQSGNAIEDNDDNFNTPSGGDFNKGWVQLIR